MTPIELRVSFKVDTGDYPTWFGDGYNRAFHLGKMKTEYGLWMEEKLGVQKVLREQYYQEERENAFYGDKPNVLTQSYMRWLENKITVNL